MNNQNQQCHICYGDSSIYKCSECSWQICHKCLNMLSIYNFQNCPHCHRVKNFINLQIQDSSKESNKNIYCQCIVVYFKQIYYKIKTTQCINRSLSYCKTVIFDTLFTLSIIIIIVIIGLLFQLLDYLINKKPINFNQTIIYCVFGIGICTFIYTILLICYNKLCKKSSNQNLEIYVVPINN